MNNILNHDLQRSLDRCKLAVAVAEILGPLIVIGVVGAILCWGW